MNKRNLIFYILAGLVILVSFLLSYANTTRGKSVDWSESYSMYDKIPLGTYILFTSMETLFNDSPTREMYQTPYVHLMEDSLITSTHTSYIFITSYFSPDYASWDALLNYVSNGNQVFIASELFSSFVQDTLGFLTDKIYLSFENDSITSRFLDPQLSSHQGYNFFDKNLNHYFHSYDSTRTIPLAINNQGNVNLINVAWGKGHFTISSTPRVFSNYHLLYTTKMDDFVATSLSYLSSTNEIFWDEYYKLPSIKRRAQQQHPLMFIQRQPSLKWAFWILVGSVILYVLFESKRKQRVIQVMSPLPNTTVEFAETLGRLYYRQQNHKDLFNKKVQILLEQIRSRFNISTSKLDNSFIHALSLKSGIPIEEIKNFTEYIVQLNDKSSIDESELMQLNSYIEEFYRKIS